jgi:hypothetical protein
LAVIEGSMVVNNRAKAAILKQLRDDDYDAFPPPSKKQESATEHADLEEDVRAHSILPNRVLFDD